LSGGARFDKQKNTKEFELFQVLEYFEIAYRIDSICRGMDPIQPVLPPQVHRLYQVSIFSRINQIIRKNLPRKERILPRRMKPINDKKKKKKIHIK
jgi:hypothetical protein